HVAVLSALTHPLCTRAPTPRSTHLSPTRRSSDLDLFVSIHVNAMPPGRRATRTSGVETYFLSDAKTEDQQRVANMENDAIRFESAPAAGGKGPIDFILKDQIDRTLDPGRRERKSTRLNSSHGSTSHDGR